MFQRNSLTRELSGLMCHMRMLIGVLLLTCAVAAQEVYKPGDGVTLPVVTKQVRPNYTSEAMSARIQGVVALDVVVKADGKVGDVTVAESLDTGLDGEAVKAVKQWEFKPGTKDSKDVAVQVQINIRFTLK